VEETQSILAAAAAVGTDNLGAAKSTARHNLSALDMRSEVVDDDQAEVNFVGLEPFAPTFPARLLDMIRQFSPLALYVPDHASN
jgi:hypothetical protein